MNIYLHKKNIHILSVMLFTETGLLDKQVNKLIKKTYNHGLKLTLAKRHMKRMCGLDVRAKLFIVPCV